MINYKVLALIIKEFLAVLRDRKTRLVLILPPIMQLFIFTFAATLDVKNVPIGILNKDSGEKSIELVQRFVGSKFFSKIYFLQSQEEVTPFIDEQKGILAIVIPQDYSKKIDSKKAANIQLILDGRRSNSSQILGGYVESLVGQYNEDLHIEKSKSELKPRNWFNPNLTYFWYNVPCLMGVLTMVVCITVTAMSVSREREMGTFDQLLVSPLTPREILIGKMVPPVLISLFEGTIIFIIGIVLFGTPFEGHIGYIYFTLIIFSLAVVGIGLFISSLSMTQQQANLGSFIFLSPAITLSGFATPIENMPHWLQLLTYLNPLRYMIFVTKGVFLKDISFFVVWEATWPLFIIALSTLSLASFCFRKQIG